MFVENSEIEPDSETLTGCTKNQLVWVSIPKYPGPGGELGRLTIT